MVPLLLGLGAPATAAPVAERFDVVVYGGNAAGVAAAVQARRMGRSAVLLEPGRRLGGLTSGGLGNTDIGNKGAVGGLSRRFYERVAAHYARPEAWVHETRDEYERRSAIDNQGHGRPDPIAARTGVPTMWVFEPRVAERILRAMADEAWVVVRYGERLDLAGGVSKKAGGIASIRMETGNVYEGRAFIDATYEGDLMAKAGVAYHVGREANAVYGETLNGVQTRHATFHQFSVTSTPTSSRATRRAACCPGSTTAGPARRAPATVGYRPTTSG
jgi:flavin-dependent dehydrogenase